ncbi:MAG: GNAT family N-acetyltransferase [Candidatus Nanoarchaeia archaeon]|jgi:ribosomal protein S18 acetylase RimI-like enzyme
MIRYGFKKDFELLIPIRFEADEHYSKLSGKKSTLTVDEFKKEFDHALSKKGVLLVAENKSKIVGFLTGTIIDNISRLIGYIDDIVIKSEYQKRGYATSLINFFGSEMKSKGIKLIKLGVRTNNDKAIKLYKKLGFSIEYYEMEKELS